MIGTKVKGFRHLIRMAKTLSEVEFFFKHDIFHIGCGIALYVSADKSKNPYMPKNGDYVMIFNESVSNVRYNSSYHSDDSIGKRIKEIAEKYPYLWIITVDRKNFNDDYHMFSQMLAVPSDFEEKYSAFCEANKKQMPNATKYADINSAALRYFFAITNGSKNFFFWAVNAYFKQNVSIFLLEKLMIWNDNYNQLSNKLKKGTITGYTNGRDIFNLVIEMSKLRRNKRANDVINMFNTAQKKALKGYKLNDRDYDTLSKFGKMSCKKKNNFIRKMSTIEDAAEILKQMSFLADIHFEWKKESLLEFIKNSEGFNCDVAIDKDDIILLKVKDYETVKRLAKTTNWCISKDKKYWNEYVENKRNATQYVLMDFSKKEDDNLSIVGFTSVHDRGITNAHDFQNKDLMKGRMSSAASEIKSFVSKYIDCSSIYGVLDKYGIKLSDVVTYEPNQYKWNRESMFDYLNQCIDEDDYYIIYDDGDKVAFIAENRNIRYFLGDAYIDNRRGDESDYQHIIFADFTKKATDPNKLVFGIITHDFDEHESACARLYNERYEPIPQSFDSKLEEYGLPYDIICRQEDVVERFYNAISSLELATAKDLLKDEKVKKELLSCDRANFVRDYIVNVTFGYNSADYINMFYDCGYSLVDIIGIRSASDIARRMLNNITATAVNFPNSTAFVPTSEDIKEFNNGKINDYNKAFYIGYFLMLMKMLDKENNNDFLCRVVQNVFERSETSDVFDLIMSRVFNKIDAETNYDVGKYVVTYAFVYNRPRVINVINSKKKLDERLVQIISSKKVDVKTTEMWVKNGDGVYVIDGINEEAAIHSPRRR